MISSRRAALAGCVVVCVALSFLVGGDARAQAQGGDYDVSSGDWNGLRDFLVLADSEQVELVVHRELDLETISVDEPLIVVYPSKVRAESLSRYAIDGGRVMVVDDFGGSLPLLERLDIQRLEPMRGTLPHDEFLDNNPALPVIRARGVHPLLDDVQIIVANHPAVLFNVGGPVLSYSADGGLVYDMNLGEGKIVVVGDASMIINHMILIADNGKFWRNSLRYLCDGKSPCRAHLYVGDFPNKGSYGESEGIFGDSEEVSEKVESLNASLAKLMSSVPAEKLLYYLGILLSIGLAAYLYTVFPLRKTRVYSAYISDARAAMHPPQSEFDWNLTRFVHGANAMNYALPVSILKELFEELFLTELELWERGRERPKIPEIVELFAQRYLDVFPDDERRKISKQLSELLATFANVPTRHRVFLDSDTYFSERDLLRIHQRSLEILDLMGLKDTYERRTRSDI